MRKIFTFLLALAASVGMMNAKVTWNSSNISDLHFFGTDSYSKEGVTLSGNGDMVEAAWDSGYGDENMDGISFRMFETGGGFTFSNTLGKNFTKIEMSLVRSEGWDLVNLGSGWSFWESFGEDEPVFFVTWKGNAKTVDLLKDESDFHAQNVKSIVFYFEGDSEEPDPTYTVALQDGTANADKVTLSKTSAVEGATITVTPNEEYEITDFSATYVVVEGQLGTINTIDATLDPATGAYSFKMPAYDVTIEATIALKPVPEGDIFAGFTATAGAGGFDNEGSANLVDNKFTYGNEQTDWTKWCADNGHKSVPTGESESCWWIDFEASAALNLTGYILTTGNDTGNEHGRNPKNWVLKAKLNADDAWTTIATVTNDVTMKNKSFKDYKFFVDQSGTYQYFRFEVFANQGANVMQLCELRLIGTETPAPAPTTTDLASITGDYTAQDGEILTGTLGVNVKISIADGATVTLLNANINGDKTWTTGEYAGITCLGDATITIVGKNSVSGFSVDNGYPGIYVPSGKTLIINGTGSLTAQSSTEEAAGIGARKNTHCGNIEIQSGKITAIAGGEEGAGIGGGFNGNCGNITISGGIVTAVGGYRGAGIGGGRRSGGTDAGHCGNILISGGVVSATSGEDAAAIGGGRGNNSAYKSNCGTITITNTALKVYADQGGSSINTIGAGKYGTCGTVTIGGNTGVINNDPYTYRTKEDGEIVVVYINAIGTVVYTQECKDKIDIARELYDALEDSQKDLVTNYQTLLDAEAAYAALIPQPAPTTYTLQLHVNDAAMGSVAVTNLLGSDIIDNGDGTYTVPEGAEVTLLAAPNEGYEFTGWKASNTICDFTECEFVALPTVDNPLTFDMYQEVAIMAEFEAVVPADQSYDLTLADVSDDHGTVVFSVDGNAATQAKKDDVVSVSVTPNEGYSAKDVAVRAYTSWEAASDILASGEDAPGLVSDVNVAKQENGTWSFTMPAANVWVVVSYSKNLQDAWIIDIPAYEYSGEAIEPTVDVMDGETALVLNSDYTVAYSNNVNAGTATVTITAVEGSNYSGSASKTFEILKAENSWTTVPAAVEGLIYSGEAQTLISAGEAVYGTVLYSLDGENYSEALPQAANAGSYTVFYKAEGDANHNGIDAQTLNVTIATDKSALNNAISEAEQYHNSISESNPGIAATLLDAINAAKGVKDNADATQSEVEDATQTLTDALNAAKAEVALKRVTVIIPAKSYMARIDADKRRIEDAVEGVQLFSVKNVTNTEVILTDELSVIAEEMPYFIYNDNDTDMEVSLVVSNADADYAAYDSEHFKGTLIDKTFTDEDMAEKDYYVLSNSNSFVWVKDAGTLSAGKCWIELGKSPAHAPRLIIVSKNTATGITNIEAGSATTKILRDGMLLIVRDGKLFNVTGALVR